MEASRLPWLHTHWNGLCSRLVALRWTYVGRYSRFIHYRAGNLAFLDFGLFAWFCNPIFCINLFSWFDEMDFAIFSHSHENWRSINDHYFYLALYRPDGADYDFLQPAHSGLAEVLSEIINAC